MRSQRGSVFLLFVVVLAVMGLTIVMGASSLQAQEAANRAAAERQTYLDEAAHAIRGWYVQNLAFVDSALAPPSVASILNQAGVNRRYGVEARASNRIAAGAVAYHVIAVWIPVARPDPSTFDLTPGSLHRDRACNTRP